MSNGQVRIEWRNGSVKLMIFQDDGSFRSIDLPPQVAVQVGCGMIQAATIAGQPAPVGVTEGDELKEVGRWVDDLIADKTRMQ